MSGRRRGGVLARWGVAVALALGVHATGAAALLARWQEETDAAANAPVILIDLAPIAAAPAAPPEDVAPGPAQPQAEKEPEPDKPVEKAEVAPEPTPEKPPEKAIELPPAPAPNPELSVLPPPKPPEKKAETKRQQRHASLPRAPSPAEQKADRTAAPAPGAVSHNANALPNWKSALLAQLERYKRYPPGASDRGVTLVSFSVDRSGGVHDAHLVRSSGSQQLDAATLELVRRAAPLPPPPPEIAGTRIAIVVPVRYNAR